MVFSTFLLFVWVTWYFLWLTKFILNKFNKVLKITHKLPFNSFISRLD